MSIQYYLGIYWEQIFLGVTIGELRWYLAYRDQHPLEALYHLPGAPLPVLLSFMHYAVARGHIIMPQAPAAAEAT